jgi:hypothetical protein
VCACVCVRRKSYDSALLRKKNKIIRMIRIKMKLSLKHHQSFLIVVDVYLHLCIQKLRIPLLNGS